MGFFMEKALLKWIFRFALLVPSILICIGGVTSEQPSQQPTITNYEFSSLTTGKPTHDESSAVPRQNIQFDCPHKCECNYLSPSQLDISCSSVSTKAKSSKNTTEKKTIDLAGIEILRIHGCHILDSRSISKMIPPFGENTLKELELREVSLEPVAFLNSPIFHKSRLSLEKLSIYDSIVPPSHRTPASEQWTPIKSFSELKSLDSLTICDSSPVLSNLILKTLPLLNHIKIANSSISELSPQSFAHLSHLKSFNLSHNQISSFPASLSSNIVSLHTLDISHNLIEHLQEQVFVGLESLVQLDVSHNKIQYIDTEVFTPLRKIQLIDLSYNEVIQFFEPYFDMNDQLRVLRMANAWIANTFINNETGLRSRLEIERLINTLQTVETLDISDNDMTIIPETLTHAPRLVIVNLEGNKWQCTCQDRWLLNWISTTGVSFGVNNDTDNVWCHTLDENGQVQKSSLSKYLKEIPTHCTNQNVNARTPFKYYAVLGKDTLLQCHTQRDPLPTVTWITPSKQYISYLDPDSEDSNSTSLATINPNGTLHISNVTSRDYGLYLCIASYSDLNITHYVHLGIDVSIFSDVRIASIIVGCITSFSFLFTVLVTQLVRSLLDRCGINCNSVSTANQARRVRTFFDSMEQNKTYQLDKLRDNYNMQAKKIKDNCFVQLERIRESYQTQTKNLCDIREYGTQQLHTVRDQYYDQIRKVSGYSAQQLCRVRENYLFQRNRVGKFSSHQLLRLRETYKWQAQTLNKILENLPRTLNFDTCRGMGACGRTDSIYLNDVSDMTNMEESSPSDREESVTFSIEKMEHISLLIPPEFVSQYIVKKSETPIAMEETLLAKIKLEEYTDKPCCSHSLRKPSFEDHEI